MARLALLAMLGAAACGHRGGGEGAPDAPVAVAVTPDDEEAGRRAALVAELELEGIRDARVLEAIGRVPRHELVPADRRAQAYFDTALPIGEGQTISQPYVVARMTELAGVGRGDRVLEIGTGSGYQAAVLAELGADVYTIEIVEPLARRARADLDRLGYARVHSRSGDGYAGWPERAPFDAVLITAAPEAIPQPLLEQLAIGGTLVTPLGAADSVQRLVVVHESVDYVVFVPMTGAAQAESR